MPNDDLGLMVVLGQLLEFLDHYQHLLDSHSNEKLLLDLEEVAQEFETLSRRIASRLSKLNSKTQTKLIDVVIHSAVQPQLAFYGGFGEEINMILETIVYNRAHLNYFENGTLRAQRNDHLEEKNGEYNEHTEMELKDDVKQREMLISSLRNSIDT